MSGTAYCGSAAPSFDSSAMKWAVEMAPLKSMVDAVLNDMINDGTIAALIKKYNAQETYAPEPDVRIPAAK